MKSPANHGEPAAADGTESQASTTAARTNDPLRALAGAAASGDAKAQRTLLIAAGPAMLRVIRDVLGGSQAEAEDALQEAMVGLHLALGGFRGECTTLHFACRIAVRTAMNARRRASYRTRHTPSAPPEELGRFGSAAESPSERLASERRRVVLQQLLAELPDAQAEVLALHVLLGYTIEETAATTGAPLNTVRSRLRAALSRLRARFQAQQGLLETIREER